MTDMAFSISLFGKELISYRSLEDPANSLSDPDVVNAFTGNGVYKSFSGQSVTPKTAMTVSAFFRGVSLLAGQIAALPLSVYRKDENGHRVEAVRHPVHKLLHTEPNHLYTSFVFRETMMVHLLVSDGNFYSIIQRDGNFRPAKLWMCDPKQVFPIMVEGQMFYFVNGFCNPFPARDMIHVLGISFDGIKGLTPLKYHAQSIGYSLTLQEFSQRFFKNGANVGAVVEHPTKMTKDQYEMFRDSWDRAYAGTQNTGKTAILQGGAKLNKVGIAPEEAQYLESRKLSVTDIARILGVPPHKIYDLDKATFSNIEQQGIEFVQDSLLTWIRRIESEFDRKLFTEREKGSMYSKFNVSGLLRGDAAARGDYYSKMVGAGIMKPDEARAKEDMNAVGGLADELHFPLNNSTESQIKAKGNEE
jgi:HK97 family phage portal protein